MKLINILYIALGLVLSMAIGIQYNCIGQEMFPTYYGSPFVFKQKSLGSSMEYFYSISGLILNTLAWSMVLYFIHKAIERINKSKTFNRGYKLVIGLLIVFTTLNVVMDSAMIGNGFDKNLNYWYWNLYKEAENWRVTCEGELVNFKK